MEVQYSESVQMDEIIRDVIALLEKNTDSKVFTIGMLEDEAEKVEDEIHAVVVFEDKRILMAVITIERFEEKAGVRVRGKFL